MKNIWLVMDIAIPGGCASKPPASISTRVTENLRLAVDRFVGSEVRRGGVINRVENKATHMGRISWPGVEKRWQAGRG